MTIVHERTPNAAHRQRHVAKLANTRFLQDTVGPADMIALAFSCGSG